MRNRLRTSTEQRRKSRVKAMDFRLPGCDCAVDTNPPTDPPRSCASCGTSRLTTGTSRLEGRRASQAVIPKSPRAAMRRQSLPAHLVIDSRLEERRGSWQLGPDTSEEVGKQELNSYRIKVLVTCFGVFFLVSISCSLLKTVYSDFSFLDWVFPLWR